MLIRYFVKYFFISFYFQGQQKSQTKNYPHEGEPEFNINSIYRIFVHKYNMQFTFSANDYKLSHNTSSL
jgi:hypothetical protein